MTKDTMDFARGTGAATASYWSLRVFLIGNVATRLPLTWLLRRG